jgi:hypothetical protein
MKCSRHVRLGNGAPPVSRRRHILGRVMSRSARWSDERPVTGDALLALLVAGLLIVMQQT